MFVILKRIKKELHILVDFDVECLIICIIGNCLHYYISDTVRIVMFILFLLSGNEHHVLTKDLKPTDVVFDVFAGIGPFAVPACKLRATVFANDLNPHSYQGLVKNIKINKCKGTINCFNLDGREFIQSCVKEQFSKLYAVTENSDKFENVSRKDITGVYVFMNLPAIASTFLDAFCELLSDVEGISDLVPLPLVQCHCFTNFQEAEDKYNGDNFKEIKHRVMNTVGDSLTESEIEVRFVRNVAPQKDMMCISFRITQKIMLGKADVSSSEDKRNNKTTNQEVLCTDEGKINIVN